MSLYSITEAEKVSNTSDNVSLTLCFLLSLNHFYFLFAHVCQGMCSRSIWSYLKTENNRHQFFLFFLNLTTIASERSV